MVSSRSACLHPLASVTTHPSVCRCLVLCLTNFLDSSTMSTFRPSKGGALKTLGELEPWAEEASSLPGTAGDMGGSFWLRRFNEGAPPPALIRTEGFT